MNKSNSEVSISMEATTPNEMTDLQLVDRCKQGDEMAFSQLVQRYQRRVYTVALGMVKNPEDAMDIAQEGFVKVHRYIANFQGSSSFYTWLYRIIINLCIDHLRKNGKHISDEYDERVHSKEGGAGVGVVSSNLGNNPSANMGRKELAAYMQQAIESLPPYHRAVILMREVEGMSYSDMASSLNISKGTVMSRLHHARQKLQALLQPYLEGDFTVN